MMPGNEGRGNNRTSFVVIVVVIAFLFGFSPISRVLLRVVHGSFAPPPFSSLSLVAPTDLNKDVVIGHSIGVLLANHTGQTENYHWIATQNGVQVHQGEERVGDGHATKILISSRGARAGRLRIALKGTKVFVTVTIRKPGQ